MWQRVQETPTRSENQAGWVGHISPAAGFPFCVWSMEGALAVGREGVGPIWVWVGSP